jgi:transcription initiation factor IIF auxiliary subunit
MSKVAPPVSQIKFANIARHVGKSRDEDWYEWAVYVNEPDTTLQQIKAVEYLLHRTFPDPLRRKTDAAKKFALQSEGWGEFDIYITVFFKNGARLETTYFLNLSKPWDSNLYQQIQ